MALAQVAVSDLIELDRERLELERERRACVGYMPCVRDELGWEWRAVEDRVAPFVERHALGK